MIEKVKSLYNGHKEKYTFYGNAKRAGFARRVKNMAAKTSISDYFAVMYLDIIATRLDIYLDFAD